ncbi:MAG: ligase-associated DNA damage response endonuclease PdeM [Lacibacter sp.]
MKPPQPYHLLQQQLWLSAERCIFWENTRMLLVSDLHFGKSGHFRKEGIGIPQAVFRNDLRRLTHSITFFKPDALLIIGDFFHSCYNKEVALFEKWRSDMHWLPIHLVQGNHDVLPEQWYAAQNIAVHKNHLEVGPFTFVHEWHPEAAAKGSYYFSGHVHPGIRLQGAGKQSMRLPCFYFGAQHAIMPAFGGFTGLHTLRPKKGDAVFAIVNHNVVALQ